MTTKEKDSTVQKEKQEFNYFDFLKFKVLKAYYMQLFQGKSTEELTISVKHLNQQQNAWFFKNGAFKFVEWHSSIDDTGKIITEVKIKDLDLEAKAKSKQGKEFKIFNSFDIAKAVKSATKALA